LGVQLFEQSEYTEARQDREGAEGMADKDNELEDHARRCKFVTQFLANLLSAKEEAGAYGDHQITTVWKNGMLIRVDTVDHTSYK